MGSGTGWLRRIQEPKYEFSALATFNAERSRGIVHTDEWRALMREEKRRFDAGEPSQFPGVDYPAMYEVGAP